MWFGINVHNLLKNLREANELRPKNCSLPFKMVATLCGPLLLNLFLTFNETWGLVHSYGHKWPCDKLESAKPHRSVYKTSPFQYVGLLGFFCKSVKRNVWKFESVYTACVVQHLLWRRAPEHNEHWLTEISKSWIWMSYRSKNMKSKFSKSYIFSIFK